MTETEILKLLSIQKQSKDELFIIHVKEYKNNLYRLAKSILRNEADVEDAVSETILRAYANIEKLRSFNKFKSWIMQILANECYKICRLRNKTTYSKDMEYHTEITYDDYDYSDEMWSFVNSLDEEFRAVVVLFYYEDISIKDISKILDLPLGTVKSRLSRARQKLKALIEKEGGNLCE